MGWEEGRLLVRGVEVERVSTAKSAFMLKGASGSAEKLGASNSIVESGSLFEMGNDASAARAKENSASSSTSEFGFALVELANITSLDSPSCFECRSKGCRLEMTNCTVSGCSSGAAGLGSAASFTGCEEVWMKNCLVEGSGGGGGGGVREECKAEAQGRDGGCEVCRWNGSLMSFEDSRATMSDSTISNSPSGGVSVLRANISVAEGKFSGNNPMIRNYSSVRRNMMCGESGVVEIASLKGGDGWLPGTSMWILSEGCELSGIAAERQSPFFIPELHSVLAEESGGEVKLTFKGALLLPCNLSFQMTSRVGDVDVIDKYEFRSEGYLSEAAVVGEVPLSAVASASDETEVLVAILCGYQNVAFSTAAFAIKNKTDQNSGGDEKILQGNKDDKSWSLIVIIILIVLFLIVLVVSILITIRWKKAKDENKDLREIVNDNIRKDPKAFEMVTMEMSPEEQWRRAEKEEEKKNEERIKKRVYAKSLQHSESSEHLLSESGSTEYILGRDSDKIPQWMLEKVDEEEEDDVSRKRTSSPSISSTSSTDTTDSDSTFVRGEDLCPTTSSMSNLVDAMACSSPHEKLIVDLRDSLFMLLHGKNEKKEMAIGSLKEREQTAAQVLFWVANGALHSFDEMENPLQSLDNLSPHIVLFSEHMVICIALHSDCSSSDSNSSSISSSTVVTSTSDDDDDDRDSLPSSAFEDEDDFKMECLRWKAPELMVNKKMGAKKKAVVFSIGMMLWECVTLKIPFGEYEAVVAGQKILNGERPNCSKASSSYDEVILAALSEDKKARPTLIGMKREFFQHFPAGAVIFTVSDAITYDEDSNVNVSELRLLASCSGSN
ncbi:uncharacterized protein MONOS_13498 [Monocercomonoides exilis]|uniref:uncharacterized protein n=1 Tax=Monocercomonoides exilis TaxID=2049356 RepID=UPI00355A20FA|nr:hypothetical protein MONOS_13498 [Monocercomonoides exilis]|eukprot:MONOS_13498.1-p1 / transcript=MONOS_13498.1 / gene=MONOS_13498 / organism=Monocercomonoides_exilis_PA203 / gene_product=unspecified product / transcript_product=unspecified product / location=Mono_scaffold00837:20-2533(+) / protein_length=837 / sequence_SO=supercontig / SO=protein_coding / is_pseudo=false